ncbi:MAG TPA: class I SAM-dependent methyltransferase [Catalimonadaceae bacterium]|nr:class I SAM-dependent methyltransferase [Catalimonadaceae bacterium]
MTNQDLHEFYENYHSNHLKHAINDFPFREAYWKNRILKFLPADKNARILDLGCGNGDFLLFAKKLGYTNITGVEYSGEMKTISEKSVSGIRIVYADATEFLKTTTESYDFILMAHLLEHFEKPKVLETFQVIRARLGSGGRFVAYTPNFASPFGLMISWGDFTHITHFSGPAMAQLAGMTQFDIAFIGGNGPVPFGLSGWLKSLLWRLILKPIGKLIFSNGSRNYGNVIDPELMAVFIKP